MRTTGPELASEAAIYAEGTDYTGKELANEYASYADDAQREGDDPDDFQRWCAAIHPECC